MITFISNPEDVKGFITSLIVGDCLNFHPDEVFTN